MASNRDPRKDYRINRRGRKVTSSADRSKRVKKASAPKPTSSSTRSRGKGTGSKRVTSDSQRVKKGLFATKGDKLNRAVRKVGRLAAKVTESGGRTQRPPASNNNRKTNLKLKGTWAQKRAQEKAIDKKWGANNREANLMNEERLKREGKTNSNQERAMRLRARNKVVEGPKSKAVRKKPVTGPPRGAQGPATPESVKRAKTGVKKSGVIVGEIPRRTNKPTDGPPGLGKVKFNPSNRVKTTASVGTLLNPRSDIPAKVLAAGSLIRDGLKSLNKRPASTKDKVKPTPGIAKGAVAKAKSDASKTNRQSKAASFDRAFAAARKAGKSTFTWKGKKYNTKFK